MEKIIVEVGSTCIKVDKYDGSKIDRIKEKTIQFKRHYNEDKSLRKSDINELINFIKELKINDYNRIKFCESYTGVKI